MVDSAYRVSQFLFVLSLRQQYNLVNRSGSNVPALNDLLQPYGISFSSSIYSGEFSLSSFKAIYSSGTSISSFPAGGKLISHSFLDEATAFLSSKSIQKEIFFFGL